MAYTILINNILVWEVHLFGDKENTISIWGYCGEFLLFCLRLCQPASMLCHAPGISVGTFCLLGPSHLAPFLQGIVGFELCMLLLYSFVHLFIPSAGFQAPLVVLGESADFWWQHLDEGPLALTKQTQCDLQYQPWHSSGGNCSCSICRFYLEDQLDGQYNGCW